MDVSAATWNTLSKLLDEALDLEPTERASWLDGLGTTQPEVAPILRKLLAAHASSETSDLLKQLPALDTRAVSAETVAGLGVGSRVGPYRLKSELGSGGMADVWLAERADGAFERDVALKLPRLSRLRRDLAERFERERDILARLEHPHIARFYDAGVTTDGLPYLAIEYVHGQSIIRWCDERRIDIAGRLRLFAQVLDAVQFAHANLVIHRDLKPSNILVTEEGQAQLLDFGIAKLLSDEEIARETRLTQFAGRVLTPDYASPEQIRGESLTTATDIYSLGVVLYELLAGQLPYQLALQSVAQLEQAIVTADPARPSNGVSVDAAQARGATEKRVIHALRGDLDTIVLKALAKKPAERYATIAELAEDLQRHLAGQTVQARPASWSYRARKFIARNRLAVAAASAISMALIAATGVSWWQAQRAEEEARRAQQQATRAEAVKKFVLSILESGGYIGGGDRQVTIVDALKHAGKRLDDSPIIDDATRAELLMMIGSSLRNFGELQLAAQRLKEATRLSSATLGDLHPVTGEARSAYGFVLFNIGEEKVATAQFDAAERVFRHTGDMARLATVLDGQATVAYQLGQTDRSLELIAESARAAERGFEADPSEYSSSRLIGSYMRLSSYTRTAGRKGSLEPARRAFELAREFWKDSPVGLLEAKTTYLAALAVEGDAALALTEMKAALREQIEILGPDNFQVGFTLGRLGAISLRLGDPVAALGSYRQALPIYLAQSAGKPTYAVAFTRANLGNVLANAHRYEEALREWREADAIYSALYGPEDERARLARSGTALTLTKLGRLDEADALFAALLKRPFHSRIEEVAIEGRLGTLRSAQGRHEEAHALVRDAPAFFADSPPERQRALALAELGHVLLAGGRHAEALEPLQQARTLLLKSQRNGSPDLADISVDIARAQISLARPDMAVAAADDAVAFWSRFDPNHRDTGVALLWQARALAASGQQENAADAVGRAGSILASSSLPADRALLQQTRRDMRIQ